MHTLRIYSEGTRKEVLFEEHIKLSDAIRQAGFSFALPCGGNGNCGKCRVRAEGSLSPALEAEKGHLHGCPTGTRLACCTEALGDAEVFLPEANKNARIQAEGLQAPAEFDSFEAGSLGMAADIGTTSIVVYLYDLANHTLLNTVCEMNRQAAFGADVISRIQAAEELGTGALHACIRGQLTEMFRKATYEAKRTLSEISRFVVTGNTTMLHFLANLDASGIAASPYTPKSLFGCERKAAELFPALAERASLYLPRCVGAYVGADITCAMLSTGMTKATGTTLLADIGTNGEIVLHHKGRLLCCSTAAGPAFEGAGISSGMTASEGAIDRVFEQRGEIGFSTVGGAPAKGLCGTGLISCVGTLLDLGVVDESGRLLSEGHAYTRFIRRDGNALAFEIGDSGVTLTQQDIRQVQLAKAAVCAGILTLLQTADCTAEDIKTFTICGGFGTSLNRLDAARIGLFPAALSNKVIAAGNSAGLGACALLLSESMRAESEGIAQAAEELPLSQSGLFTDTYIDCMNFSTGRG